LLISLTFIFNLWGKAGISVETHVSKSEMTIGDKISYKITVTYPLGGSLNLPAVLGNLGSFEVKAFTENQPIEIDNARVKTWEITLSTFTTGEYTIPPQIVEYIPEDDTTKYITYTEPIVILVSRTTAETVTDIADITGLAKLKEWGNIKVWMILLLFFIMGVTGLWYFFFRGRLKAHSIPPVLPYEAAVDSLSQLAQEELLTKGRHKEYCFRLSEILRKFLNGRYSLDALESTTEEFLKVIVGSPLTQANRDSIIHFCRQTDPVKFAKIPLTVDEGRILFDEIKSVIYQNKPRDISRTAETKKRETE